MSEQLQISGLPQRVAFPEKTTPVHCDRHGTSEVVQVEINTRWYPEEPGCRACADEKLAERARKCEGLKRPSVGDSERYQENPEMYLGRRMQTAGIGLRFKDRTLKDFTPLAGIKAEKALATMLDYAEHWPERRAAGSCLVLCGTTGTGKTHLATGLMRQIISQHDRVTIQYATVSAMFRAIKESWGKKAERSEREVLADYTRPDLLVLDEAGVQFGSDTERQLMFEVLNDRYESLRPTLLISNLTLAELNEMVGQRVIDRMRENGGKVIICDWKSHRGEAA